jgi:hypothetical protein
MYALKGVRQSRILTLLSCTVQHYAAYNLEMDLEQTPPDEWCGSTKNEGGACTTPNSRHSFNAHVSPRDLSETYLPPFQRAVDAGAGAIMCSCTLAVPESIRVAVAFKQAPLIGGRY